MKRPIKEKYMRGYDIRKILLAGITCLGLSLLEVDAQPLPEGDDRGKLHWQLDSISREVERTLYTDKEKAEIRACGRGKDSLMRALRAGDGEYARLNEAMSKAKLADKDPDEDEVRRLLEAKYALEEGFNRRYEAEEMGRRCLQGAKEREEKLRRKLADHGDYRRVKRLLAEAEGADKPD